MKARYTYSEPLCIISLAHAEQSLERVISWDQESGEVHEELAATGTCEQLLDEDFFGSSHMLKKMKKK